MTRAADVVSDRPVNHTSPADNDAAEATPRLAGARVLLRPVGPSDYERLRVLELAPQLLWRWRHTGATPAPEQWLNSLWNGVTAQYLVIDHRTREWIGITSAYNADMRNGHAAIAAAKFNQDDHGRRMLEGAIVFIDYVFATWPFRKLYMEVPGYNIAQLRSGIGRLLAEEGRLVRHVWLNGRHWDLHVLALHRDAWESRREQLVRVATRSRELDA